MACSLLLTVNDYFLEDDILYHLWTPTGRKKKGPFVQLVVPKGLQLQILQGAHDDVLAGHLGVANSIGSECFISNAIVDLVLTV